MKRFFLGSLGIALCFSLTHCSSLLYYPSKENYYRPQDFGYEPRDIHLKTSDGLNLHAWHFPVPSQQVRRGWILVCHGNAANVTNHFPLTAWLSKEGYDVLIFDYRGYGLSEGSPSPRGTVEDARTALDWILTKAKQETLPAIVYGQSLGGAICLRAVLDRKERDSNLSSDLHGVIAESSFVSYRSVGKSVLSKHALTWLFQPLAYVLLSDRHAPRSKIDQLPPIPLLVVHGREDPIVVYRQGEYLFESASQPKEFWTVEHGHHIDSFFGADGKKWREKLLKKLSEWTPTRSAP